MKRYYDNLGWLEMLRVVDRKFLIVFNFEGNFIFGYLFFLLLGFYCYCGLSLCYKVRVIF